ncbi:MAG: mitochondrial fission ELM1 family protein [Pseudomonadota bacterium]
MASTGAPSIWIITSGRRGDIVQCEAIAHHLSDDIRHIKVTPKPPFEWLMPWGPIDPRDRELIKPPYPDLIIASGRRSVPYVRRVVRASNGTCRALFMKNPGCDISKFGIMWLPFHDQKPGDDVIETLTAPHLITADRLQNARHHPTPEIAKLPGPRLGLVLGGNSRRVTYDTDTIEQFGNALETVTGFRSMAVTGSRRTPAALLDEVAKTRPELPKFIWDGGGRNPYFQILAHADALLVTGDSHNLVSEALAVGKRVYVFSPPGNAEKFDWTLGELEKNGLISPFPGPLKPGDATPYDVTGEIALKVREMFNL